MMIILTMVLVAVGGFYLGMVFWHGQRQPDDTNYKVLRILTALGTVVSGAFLGAMTAYNSGFATNTVFPSLMTEIGNVADPVVFFVVVGVMCGFCTGLSAVLPLGEE